MKKGDEIKEFYFIGTTRRGCPIIQHRKLGDKGIYLIEVSRVGKSLKSDGHIKRVRVTGFKEDGKTEYQMYFDDVFTSKTDALYEKYKLKSQGFLSRRYKQAKVAADTVEKYKQIILENIKENQF